MFNKEKLKKLGNALKKDIYIPQLSKTITYKGFEYISTAEGVFYRKAGVDSCTAWKKLQPGEENKTVEVPVTQTLPEKTYKMLEDYIYAVIEAYIPLLLLQRHTFKVEKMVKGDTSNKGALMACIYNYPYLNVTIKYSEQLFEMYKKGEDIVPTIVHEMCHPITDPLYSKATGRYVSQEEILDERENLTDLICNIVLKSCPNPTITLGDSP